ncbi:hypothetical protein VB620_03105 [Nodularia harveyana UHCC-0300]|uniref:Uncharacterized protein n=1 Tax=Nodularia harveyana UHCC-0300 TaxID=2974287 RepID=A0ABU5UBJ4_9CYAN|nr:hypothetical protein [Nodularia harveyana]MEA5580326.1 hypothetical protein [Nodularia harveyana UHCC-0300]
MKVFCIDPFLLAYPRLSENTNNCSDQFENYINTLVQWGEFIDDNKERENFYISFITADVLAQVNGYPEWEELERIINHLNLSQIIQPHDIHTLINNIINLPCIEDKINIQEILFDNEQVQCHPCNYLLEREPIFQENYYRIAILECLLETLTDEQVIHKLLLTRHHTNNSQNIILKAEVLDYDLIDKSQGINLYKPYLVESELIYCINPEYISTLYDSVLEEIIDIWQNSTSETIYVNAIKRYIKDANSKLEQPKAENDIVSWSFGTKFVETIKNLGFANEDRKIKMLLRSCAETILEENLSDTHWLRTGKGAKTAQRERNDKAKAWRRDIDYEYHLHYWKRTNNKIEFASIVIHNDMKIPE